MSLPQTMTAIGVETPGGPNALVPVSRPLPAIGPEDILVRVEAAGVNRADVLQRRGHYKPPPGTSDIIGLEVAGTVAATGSATRRYRVGDRVAALIAGGGYAEYCAVNEGSALPVPAGLTMVEAGAVPEAFATVWSNVFQRAKLAAGETLLAHGGASGIGTTAIQLGKAFGARVIVTAGSPERCAACIRLGADVAIDYRDEDFVARVREATGGRGADVILDIVGGDYIRRNYQAAAENGRIVQIATSKGPVAESDFLVLMQKQLTHAGSMLRPRSTAFKAALMAELEAKVWPLLAKGTVKPVIDATFPLVRAADAHARLEGPDHFGKIVLTVGEA
jgi:NADPH2:quinone reductase